MFKEQSELLTQFYQAYLAWVEDGAPIINPNFKRRYGLCANVCDWAPACNLVDEMTDQFEAAELNLLYPFNDYGADYKQDSKSRTHHLNEKRIQWVRDHANQENKGL